MSRFVPPSELPEGSIPHFVFAEQIHIGEAKIRAYIRHGIRGDTLEAIVRPKPNRPHENEYWFSPELQLQAKVYWKRHGVPFYGQSD